MNALLFNTSSDRKVVRGHKTSNSFTDDDVDGSGTGLGGSATSTVGFSDVGSGNGGSDVEPIFKIILTTCYSNYNRNYYKYLSRGL